jgi:hypothetical protein
VADPGRTAVWRRVLPGLLRQRPAGRCDPATRRRRFGFPSQPLRFEASADDSSTGNNGIALVEYKVDSPGVPREVLVPVTGGPPWPFDWSETEVETWLGPACTRLIDA